MTSSMPKELFLREMVYSQWCVWDEEEDVHMVKQVLGRWLGDMVRHWVNPPTDHGRSRK